MGIDLSQSFNNILDEYGYNILLVSQNKKKHCSCWDEKTQSADRKCPFCYGLGFVPVIQRHLVRDMDSSDSSSYFGTQGNIIGDMVISKRFYFFKNNVKVQENDLIVDVDWAGEKPVYKDRGIYQVSHIDPQRFKHGELIFQKVHVKDNPIYKHIRGIKIVENAGKIFYQLAEGK
ncbi:hypothetical protein [Tetragenococcus halophilus]|uniref:hypothetical protein n=1 Tax=Tetragenococcus halophilus TaxID=51669 RepID=UPI00300FF0AD